MRSHVMFSAGMPAAPNRSSTCSSIPHVIGLINPSGGGGEYADRHQGLVGAPGKTDQVVWNGIAYGGRCGNDAPDEIKLADDLNASEVAFI